MAFEQVGARVRLPTPEERVDSAEPPIALELKCLGCGTKLKREFEWLVYDPRERPADDGWDGFCPSSIVTCSCGAVDQYRVEPSTYLKLMAQVLNPKPGSRLVVGSSALWDGTPCRRPTQALARLRELCHEQPANPEAFLRLGNGCRRFGELDDALAAWRKVVELDPDHVEALLVLATTLWHDGPADASESLEFFRKALNAFPKARVRRPDFEARALNLAEFSQTVADGLDEPFGLMIAWRSGSVNGEPLVTTSLVRPLRVRTDRLAEFLVRPEVLTLDWMIDPGGPRAGQLEELLTKSTPISTTGSPARAEPKVGRNAPCPCGSGKKAKRCCGA